MPPNWISGLFGKRNQDASEGAGDDDDSIQKRDNPQSAIRNTGAALPEEHSSLRGRQEPIGESRAYPQSEVPQYEDADDAPVSPLAMMNEKSPEAWLGRFLTILGAPPALQYSTIRAAKEDGRLTVHLQGIIESAGRDQPVRLLEPGYADALKAKDWAVWWRASETLGRYCYAILSLIMLGDTLHNSDLATMYRQEANSRINKDAHYVICYVLGKDWPGYKVTPSDLARLSQ